MLLCAASTQHVTSVHHSTDFWCKHHDTEAATWLPTPVRE